MGCGVVGGTAWDEQALAVVVNGTGLLCPFCHPSSAVRACTTVLVTPLSVDWKTEGDIAFPCSLHLELNSPHRAQPPWRGHCAFHSFLPWPHDLTVCGSRSEPRFEFTFNVMNKTNFSMQRKVTAFPTMRKDGKSALRVRNIP